MKKIRKKKLIIVKEKKLKIIKIIGTSFHVSMRNLLIPLVLPMMKLKSEKTE